MGVPREISQRDLRLRSKEIMDAVEHGETFTVTRDGREIGELVPLRHRQRFVPRAAFLAGVAHAPEVDADRFRADLDESLDWGFGDPYER